MFCYKEEFQVELSHKIVLWQIFISHRSAWFPLLLSACHLAEFETIVICHVFMHCSGSFLLQDMLSRDKIWNKPWKCCLLAFYIVRQAQLWLQMFATSVGRSLITDNIFCSRTIVLGDAVAFLWESYTFVYVMFLAAIFLLLYVLVYSSCSCLRSMQLCWRLRVCFATVWLSSVFVLWLAYLIG